MTGGGMRRIVFALAMICGLSSIACAGFDEGMAAFKRGDYETAYRALKPFAEQGNASGQSALGLMYARGMGVPQNYDEAISWFRKAAAQGNAQGQFNLGFMYSKGMAVSQDYSKAVNLFRKAAEQGFEPAQFSLGFLYGMGTGVQRDDVKSHMWFSLAAGQENEDAVILRDRIAEKMTPADLTKSTRLLVNWLADHGQ